MANISNMMSLLNGGMSVESYKLNEESEALMDNLTEIPEQIIQETTAELLPEIMDGLVMDQLVEMAFGPNGDEELAHAIDEATVTVTNYMVGQGLLSESAASDAMNKRITFVRLNKEARIKQICSTLVMKMGKLKMPTVFKKFKLFSAMKRKFFQMMKDRFEKPCMQAAKKIYKDLMKHPKVSSTAKAAAKAA